MANGIGEANGSGALMARLRRPTRARRSHQLALHVCSQALVRVCAFVPPPAVVTPPLEDGVCRLRGGVGERGVHTTPSTCLGIRHAVNPREEAWVLALELLPDEIECRTAGAVWRVEPHKRVGCARVGRVD